jgi:hypothetical protein
MGDGSYIGPRCRDVNLYTHIFLDGNGCRHVGGEAVQFHLSQTAEGDFDLHGVETLSRPLSGRVFRVGGEIEAYSQRRAISVKADLMDMYVDKFRW